MDVAGYEFSVDHKLADVQVEKSGAVRTTSNMAITLGKHTQKPVVDEDFTPTH